MESGGRFFRKYFLSTVLILLLFIGVNLGLVIGVLAVAERNSADPDIPVVEISRAIHVKSDGSFFAEPSVLDVLKEKNAWAMIVDDGGTVCWEENMPEELPRKYTPADAAKFSRWYLQDYPTYVYEHPAGLLVIGCQPGSLVKWNFSLDRAYVVSLLVGTALMVGANLLLFLFLILRNTGKVERAISPILRGIEQISQGKPVSLEERGELGEISRKLNAAGAHLSEKEQARAEWISGISHDVRTPLSYILGYAGGLEENSSLPEQVREQAGTIRVQGEKLRRLIADLNLCSRLEYSMEPMHTENMDLLEILRRVAVQYLESGLEEKYSLSLEADPGESYFMKGDPALLMRMAENLINNAVVHNPQGCIIRVSLHREGESYVLSVRDDGQGAPEETLRRLNSGSFLSSMYQKDGEAAHGMGLRLVCRIAEVHRGTVCFKASPPHGFEAVIRLNAG